MTRVLVAASAAVVRAGLESLVASSQTLDVAGRSTGGAALAEDVARFTPDVVLLELEWQQNGSLPDWETLTTGHAGPGHTHGEPGVGPALVVLADDPRGTWTADALRAGVHAILPREASPAEIIAAVQSAAAGLIALHPEALATLLPLLSTPPRTPLAPLTPQQALTAREIEVLTMLAEGLGNKIIARRLGVSEHTVKFHVGSILSKLNATSRTEAVTIGARQGLIML